MSTKTKLYGGARLTAALYLSALANSALGGASIVAGNFAIAMMSLSCVVMMTVIMINRSKGDD